MVTVLENDRLQPSVRSQNGELATVTVKWIIRGILTLKERGLLDGERINRTEVDPVRSVWKTAFVITGFFKIADGKVEVCDTGGVRAIHPRRWKQKEILRSANALSTKNVTAH